jgi:hypothetical protein
MQLIWTAGKQLLSMTQEQQDQPGAATTVVHLPGR